ncbi:MAG: DUF5908 family protein [Bacteroidota bacterium]
MPVEIRELVIKATVDPNNNSTNGTGSNNTGSNTTPGEEMIKLCVDKVLEILKEKNER